MKRYGSREIANVVLKNITTGEPVLFLETLKVSSLDIGATQVDARGSRGNVKLISWSSDKEATFKCEVIKKLFNLYNFASYVQKCA